MKEKKYRFWLCLLLQGIIFFLSLIPRSVLHGMMASIGNLGYVLAGRSRRLVLSQLEMAFGNEKSLSERKKIARKVFVHFAIFFADWAKMSRMSPEAAFSLITNRESFYKEFAAQIKPGQPFLLVTAHFGNWELLGAAMHEFVPNNALAYVIGRRLYYEGYNKLIVGWRERFGVKTIYRDDSFRTILRALKNGKGIGMLMDQDVESLPGIFVPFFGKMAYTTDSAAKLAVSLQAPIFPIFLVRKGLKYELVFDSFIWPQQTDSKEKEIERLTREYTSRIEKVIRSYPDQWGWIHRRWKTRPPAEAK